MSSRREQIEAMLVDEPEDVYLRYCLALEMRSADEHDDSIAILTKLTEEQPPHVPSFFMIAQQMESLGRIADARTFLRNGIDQAREQGDGHAAAEMSEMLASLGSAG